ncbi:copper resistance D family protein [Arenibacterium sp. CAU 1754]
MPDTWSLGGAVLKYLLYLGALGASGTVFVQLLFPAPLEAMMGALRLRALSLACLALGAAILGFLWRGGALAGDLSGLIDPELLTLLWGTPVGDALILRLLGGVILIAGLLFRRPMLWFSAAGAAITLWSFVRIGHLSETGVIWVQGALMLHLVCASVWIGVLAPFRALAGRQLNMTSLAQLGTGFGRFGLMAIPVLVGAGLWMALTLVGSGERLFGLPYGRVLMAKILLVSIMLGFGALNKFRFVPAVQRGEAGGVAGIRRAVVADQWIVHLVFALTAALTSLLALPDAS